MIKRTVEDEAELSCASESKCSLPSSRTVSSPVPVSPLKRKVRKDPPDCALAGGRGHGLEDLDDVRDVRVGREEDLLGVGDLAEVTFQGELSADVGRDEVDRRGGVRARAEFGRERRATFERGRSRASDRIEGSERGKWRRGGEED